MLSQHISQFRLKDTAHNIHKNETVHDQACARVGKAIIQ